MSSTAPSTSSTRTQRATTQQARTNPLLPEPLGPPLPPPPGLTIGDVSKRVESAEKRLHALGYGTGKTDRRFTARTETAVRKFQGAMGLPETGRLDDRTIAKLKDTAAAHKKHPAVMARGQAGRDVKRAEERLHKLGYDTGKVDGVFDGKTAAAARAYKHDEHARGPANMLGTASQRDLRHDANALNHDPERTRRTKTEHNAHLDARVADAASRPHGGQPGFGVGTTGKPVEVVQQHLKAAGFDPAHVNGTFDERTAGALKAFQRKSGLPASGRVDTRTWNKLKGSTIEATSATSPAQSIGERSAAVKRTEKMLKSAGLSPGRVDGKYTKATERAVDKFRAKHHMRKGDGVGAATLKALKKATSFHPGTWKPGPGHLYGGDFSSYQSQSLFNAATRRAKWASVKATEGHTYTDPTFKHRWDQLGDRVKSGKMKLRIAYHFMTPGDGKGQAKHFLHALGIHGKLKPGTRLALDWEADAVSDPRALRDAAQHIHKVTGVWPLVYASDSNLGAAKHAVPHAYLWDAKWGGSVPKNVPFVQTSDGPGYDHDVFNGNLAALERFAGWRA